MDWKTARARRRTTKKIDGVCAWFESEQHLRTASQGASPKATGLSAVDCVLFAHLSKQHNRYRVQFKIFRYYPKSLSFITNNKKCGHCGTFDVLFFTSRAIFFKKLKQFFFEKNGYKTGFKMTPYRRYRYPWRHPPLFSSPISSF